MLLHPTLNQIDQLGLAGMAKAFRDLADNPEAKTLDHAEWLGLLLDREATERQDRRLKSRLRNAKLRYSQACVEDIDFTKDRGLDQPADHRSRRRSLATRASQPPAGRRLWMRQNLVILCAWPKSGQARVLGPLPPSAQAVR